MIRKLYFKYNNLLLFAIMSLIAISIVLALAISSTHRTNAEKPPPITTNTSADQHDLNYPNGPYDGICDVSDEEGLQCSLRASIEEVNATSASDSIIVANVGSDYVLSLGPLFIMKDISLLGSGMPVIDGADSTKIIDVATSSAVTISDMTITKGRNEEQGGAIYNAGSLTLKGVTISNSWAYYEGGGIANVGGVLRLFDSTISGNESEGQWGGGIVSYGGEVEISGSHIIGNRIPISGDGGGLWVGYRSIASASTGPFTKTRIKNTIFESNSAEFTVPALVGGGFGGGLQTWGGTTSLLNVEFKDNKPYGIFNDQRAALTATNVVVSGGTAAGIGQRYSSAVSLNNVTLVDNKVGIYSPPRQSVNNDPGNIVTMRNTVLLSNWSGNCAGVVISLGNNVEDGNTCGFSSPVDWSNTSPGINTTTFRPNPGAFVIDRGNNSTCAAFDLAGQSRPGAGYTHATKKCDIGAYEDCPTSDACQPASSDGDADDDLIADGSADPDGAGPIKAGPDNCTTISNTDQIDSDFDGRGDKCDSTPVDLDSDNDLVLDADEDACTGNPAAKFNPSLRPERVDGIYAGYDDDGDGAVDEPLPSGVANNDCDGDGFTYSVEAWVFGTSGNSDAISADQDPCGRGSSSERRGWPADLVNNNLINTLDSNAFSGPPNRYNTGPGKPNYEAYDATGFNGQRFDLNPINHAINGQDVGRLGQASLKPPMLDRQPALNGPSCPWN